MRNAPGGAKAPSNVVLENASANLARGSRNMSSAALAAAKKGQRISAIKVAGKSVVSRQCEGRRVRSGYGKRQFQFRRISCTSGVAARPVDKP